MQQKSHKKTERKNMQRDSHKETQKENTCNTRKHKKTQKEKKHATQFPQ